jgi:hypothetical protein
VIPPGQARRLAMNRGGRFFIFRETGSSSPISRCKSFVNSMLRRYGKGRPHHPLPAAGPNQTQKSRKMLMTTPIQAYKLR